ncbi:hypothetical protein [Streptodolium elevatio]|uniref:DUF732 domain-containing protein n=1 Tax=Streptodolium elevatio TaxID=3157996 RepID=A0ABV3DBF4_9ACTN
MKALRAGMVVLTAVFAAVMLGSVLMFLVDGNDDDKPPARATPAPTTSKPPITDAAFAQGVRTSYKALAGKEPVVLGAMSDAVLGGEARTSCGRLFDGTAERMIVDDLVARHGGGAPSAGDELFWLVRQSAYLLCPDAALVRGN